MKKTLVLGKRVLCYALVVLFAITAIIPLMSEKASAEEDNFDVYMYIADNMLTQDTPAGASLKFYTEKYKTLAEIMAEGMTDDFKNGVVAWESINLALSPDDIAKKPIEAYGYYTTVLLSMLKCTYECEPISTTIGLAKNAKSFSTLYGDFASYYKLNAKVELGDMLAAKDDFTDEDKEQMYRLQKEWLNTKGWIKKGDSLKNIMKAVEVIDDVNKGVERFVQYSMLCQINSEWQESLEYMLEHCDQNNEPLKQALTTIIDSSESYELALAYSIKDDLMDTDAEVAGLIIDGLVDIICDKFPIIKGIKIGQSVGKTLSNMLFATDKTIEKYYIVNAYCQVLNLFKESYNNTKNIYLNSKTTENAKKFIVYTDMYFTTLNIGEEFGRDFAKTIYSGGILNKLFGSAEEYNQIIKSSENNGKTAQESYKAITSSWLYDLYDENPEMYEIYATILKGKINSSILVTRVEFEAESVEWGLEDSILYGYECTVYPTNASYKALTYTCSDPSILEFLPNGRISLFKTGECVVTATSVESGHSDTLNVKVVEGSGEDGTSIALLTPITKTVPEASDFTYEISDNQVSITAYKGNLVNIIIPDKIEGYPVTKIKSMGSSEKLASVEIPEGVTTIESFAFRNRTSLTEITIPEGVITIGDGAFSGCTGLTEITIPESVTTIGSKAFENCTKLTTLNLPSVLPKVDGYYGPFYHCSNLKNVVFEKGTTEIPARFFEDCTGLTEITIPEGVTTIGASAFYGCTGLTEITIPEGVTTIGGRAFGNCTRLMTLNLPTVLPKVEGSYGPFYQCSNLKNVVFEKGTTEIPARFFEDCTGLTEITIPEGVTTIGGKAFGNCTRLMTLNLPTVLPKVEGSYGPFYQCSNLKNVVFAKGTTKIPDDFFEDCTGLTEITIPEGATTIGASAFYGCTGLTEITIPEGVTIIGSYAFANCTKLTTLNLPSVLPKVDVYASPFNHCDNLTNIVFEKGTTEIPARFF